MAESIPEWHNEGRDAGTIRSVTINWGPAVLRWTLGAVFIGHGLLRLVPMWRGSAAVPAELLETLAFAPGVPVAAAVGSVDVAGGLLLVLGAYTGWAALLLALETGFLIWTLYLPHGFFLNWTLAAGTGHGVEYHLVVLAALLCLASTGPGALSIDARRARAAEAEAAGRQRLQRHSL